MAPFKSKAQMRRMFAKNPEMAREWAGKMTHEQIERLPEKVKKRKK